MGLWSLWFCSYVAQTEGDTGYDYDDAYDELYMDNDLGKTMEASFYYSRPQRLVASQKWT